MLGTLWIAAWAAWAPAGGDCPDQVVEQVAPDVRIFLQQKCGGGINVAFQGVRIRTPRNRCPLFVIITPGYAKTVHRAGSGTFTRAVKTVDIVRLDFQCVEHWLLGVIPIPVASSCRQAGEKKIGAVTHYEQVMCRSETVEARR